MTTESRNETAPPRGPRVHDIGPGGEVTIAVEADDVRVRGVDGTEARVVAPADGTGIETVGEPGRFSVRTSRHVGIEKATYVGIQIGSRGFGMPLRLRVSGTIEVEVPRDARVIVSSTAGDVAVRDVLGGATVRTTSGDVSLKRVAGSVTAEAASGDVHVTAGEPVALEVRAVSGDVEARAPRFERVAIETVSGDVELAGAFAPRVSHAVSTTSGDVELAPVGGLTLAVRTVSGSVECSHPDRREGDGRKLPLVIGDGAARLSVRTMSGDVDVRAGRLPSPASDDADDRAADARFGFQVPTPPVPAMPPIPAMPPMPPIPAMPPIPPVPHPTGSWPAAAITTEVTQAAPAAPAGDAPTPESTPAATTLDILEALARGEMDVAEAERRLAGGHATHAGSGAEGPIDG
jgi:hypothetical protein